MKVDTPEIRWHCGPTGLNEAVLTIDFLRPPAPESSTASLTSSSENPVAILAEKVANVEFPSGFHDQVFATGGADKEIKLWAFNDQRLMYVHGLSGHDRSVNCVRFSPNGEYLASASDDSTIVIWMRPKHIEAAEWSWHTISSNSDVTRVLLTCGHKGDITDIAWSPDSAYLSSVSIDNTCAIWHIGTGKLVEKRKDHTQYVQGVAWDPLSEFLITEGNDRSCRVYNLTGYANNAKKKKCQFLHTIRSREFDNEPTVGDKKPKHSMFHDDTFPAFSRRLSWAPDGSYCLVPTGLFKATSAEQTPKNTVYAYARGNLTQPAFHLPGHEKGALCVRFSPILYALQKANPNLFELPYRFVFAIATLNAVAIYDSQLTHPIAVIDRLHYADLTDMSWSSNGRMLCLTSLDGYISFITFDDSELGESLPSNELSRLIQDRHTQMYSNQASNTKKRAPKSAQEPEKSPVPPASGKKRAADVTKSPVITKKPPPASSILQFTQVVAPDSGFSQPALGPLMGLAATPDTSVSSAPVAKPQVHQVLVRKKRKISPVLVTPASKKEETAPQGATPAKAIEIEDDSDTKAGPEPQSDATTTTASKIGSDADPKPDSTSGAK